MESNKKQNRITADLAFKGWAAGIDRTIRFSWDALKEIFLGARAGTLPWSSCLMWGMGVSLVVIYDLDTAIFRRFHAGVLYPKSIWWFTGYYLVLILSGFWFWGMYRAGVKIHILRRLTHVFKSTGLRNALGELPSFICDRPIDAHTRMMRLTKRSLALDRFEGARPAIESALHIYIDELRDHRRSGTVDIIYAHEPMPDSVVLRDCVIPKDQIIVGTTRSGQLMSDFRSTPHILVAGQTGGGKSTCVRQWITTLYLSNPSYKFTLIDLKGAIEFQLFEKIPRVEVYGDMDKAIQQLDALGEELEDRMKILKANGAKDLETYRAIPAEERKAPERPNANLNFDRHVIVIDEVAELFLSGGGTSGRDAQRAREVVSKIARQGRAVGLNLIVGTQRPDAKALDTQVKANLTGKICFQMADQHSSLVVLGNARAKDLPPIPGRAIWQNGIRQIEIQVPFLDYARTEKLLDPFSKESKSCQSNEASTQTKS